MQKKQLQKNSGFTLIETLVSFAIFSFAIIAIVAISATGISDLTIARNRLAAGYLAQEGIEMVRAIRDNAFLADATSGGTGTTNGWGNFLSAIGPCDTGSGGCDFDPMGDNGGDFSLPILCSDPFNATPDPNACVLKIDTVTGYYSSSGVGALSPLKRVITVDPGRTPDEQIIKSTVSWRKGLNAEQVQVTENVYNWN